MSLNSPHKTKRATRCAQRASARGEVEALRAANHGAARDVEHDLEERAREADRIQGERFEHVALTVAEVHGEVEA